MSSHHYEGDVAGIDLEELCLFLMDRRNFLLRLLENPALLDNESFTELFRAGSHLTEGLDTRKERRTLPDSDLRHLAGEMNRVGIWPSSGWHTCDTCRKPIPISSSPADKSV